LFVGSLIAKKGVDVLVRVFAEIAALRPQVSLRLVGDGYLRPQLEQQVQAAGLSHRISFAGFVDHEQLWQEFGAAQIFCHPSRTAGDGNKEGIPGTIVEAMATGLPVVTTDHAGIPEMVSDKRHGFVVPERDAEALKVPLLRLIDNADLRANLGRQASQQAHEHADARRQTARLEGIYREVISSNRRNL
jgi:colanic acid/amylovoran biosynthesis glycosyltransferase